MKRYVEVESICPFIGKPCIKDGWQWNSSVIHPCAFFDEYACSDTEPCLIKRAVNTILKRSDKPETNKPVDVPFERS